MFYDEDDEPETEEDFLLRELDILESLEEILREIEGGEFEDLVVDDVLPDEDASDIEDFISFLEEEDEEEVDSTMLVTSELEKALLQGVVPAAAGVGSECLPGDFGFDTFDLATKDYIFKTQYTLLQLLPGAAKDPPPLPRPSALILRDYREAEIQHGRLAMLAAVFWPLQEMLDRFFLDEDKFGPLLYGPVHFHTFLC
jgi:hypothetical protein